MKLNFKPLAIVGRFVATVALCVSAMAFVWQGAFFSNNQAMAAPSFNLIATADAGNVVKGKASEDAGRAKNFIRDTADKVERTAKKNASKVADATDDDNFVARKAKRDAATIQKRAEEDAARTSKAVDKTKNAVKGAVDKVKDGLND